MDPLKDLEALGYTVVSVTQVRDGWIARMADGVELIGPDFASLLVNAKIRLILLKEPV